MKTTRLFISDDFMNCLLNLPAGVFLVEGMPENILGVKVEEREIGGVDVHYLVENDKVSDTVLPYVCRMRGKQSHSPVEAPK